MDKKIKLAVIGGMDGSGKTTAIYSLSKQLTAIGKKVWVVTNGQDSDFFDANSLASAGFPVVDEAGGCFCCHFEEFAKKMSALNKTQMPDIVLAEPLGSCADFISAIYQPMQMNLASKFSLAPICVVVDPKRANVLMMNETMGGFEDEADCLFAKQADEADVIILNKTDLYEEQELESIEKFLSKRFKGAVIAKVSAKSGENLACLLPILLGSEATDKPIKELDFSVYGLAEDFLSWFSGTAFVSSSAGGDDFKPFISDFIKAVRKEMVALDKEVAHLKVYLISKTDYLRAGVTLEDDEPKFSNETFSTGETASFVVNARINIEPEVLEPLVQQAFEETTIKHSLTYTGYKADFFKPSKPDPTARLRAQGIDIKCACCAGAAD
jgi:G3E family GTPase